MRLLPLFALLTSLACSTVDDGARTVAPANTTSPEEAATLAIKVANGSATAEEEQALDAYLKAKH